MITILEILKGTPYWVWITLGYILFVGIKAISGSTGSIYRLAIMPIIFISWSLFSLFNKCTIISGEFIFWALAFIIGILIGYKILGKILKVTLINNDNKIIKLEGSWIPLILGLTFFLVKYTLGASCAINTELRSLITIKLTDLITSGLISGISLGRFIIIYLKSQKT